MNAKKLRNELIGLLGRPLLELLRMTLRITVEDRGRLFKRGPDERVIFAFWHNRMLLMPHFYREHVAPRQCVCLVSASSDGEMIARIIESFGMKTARGSSSRRGKEALFELATHLENGFEVAITPDGPRGPRYQVQQGILGLAQRTGTPIYPISYVAGRKLELKSWDKFVVPLPFSRCKIVIGEPIFVRKTNTEEQFDGERRKLEEALLRLGDEHPQKLASSSSGVARDAATGRRGDGAKTIQGQ